MSSEHKFYSAAELAGFKIPRYPTSDRGMRDVCIRENWPKREMPSRGGKRGIRTEYQPPPDIQHRIDEMEVQRAAVVAEQTRKPYDSRPTEALRHVASALSNPEAAMEGIRRLRDQSDLLFRVQQEAEFQLPGKLASTLANLLFFNQITELGVRELIQHMKGEQ